jgi:hypothetical protein
MWGGRTTDGLRVVVQRAVQGNPETATAPITLLQNWNPDAKTSRNTKLNRDVALKVLPDSFASDRNAAKAQANLFIERLRWKSTPFVPT